MVADLKFGGDPFGFLIDKFQDAIDGDDQEQPAAEPQPQGSNMCPQGSNTCTASWFLKNKSVGIPIRDEDLQPTDFKNGVLETTPEQMFYAVRVQQGSNPDENIRTRWVYFKWNKSNTGPDGSIVFYSFYVASRGYFPLIEQMTGGKRPHMRHHQTFYNEFLNVQNGKIVLGGISYTAAVTPEYKGLLRSKEDEVYVAFNNMDGLDTALKYFTWVPNVAFGYDGTLIEYDATSMSPTEPGTDNMTLTLNNPRQSAASIRVNGKDMSVQKANEKSNRYWSMHIIGRAVIQPAQYSVLPSSEPGKVHKAYLTQADINNNATYIMWTSIPSDTRPYGGLLQKHTVINLHADPIMVTENGPAIRTQIRMYGKDIHLWDPDTQVWQPPGKLDFETSFQYETVPTFKKTVDCVSTSTNSVQISLVEYEPFVGKLAFLIKRHDGSVVKQQVANDKTNVKVENLYDLPYGLYSLTVTGEKLNRSNHSGNIQIMIDGNTVMDEMLGFHGEGNWSGYEYTFCLVQGTSSTQFTVLSLSHFNQQWNTNQKYGVFGPIHPEFSGVGTVTLSLFRVSANLGSELEEHAESDLVSFYYHSSGGSLIKVESVGGTYVVVPIVDIGNYKDMSGCFYYTPTYLSVSLQPSENWLYSVQGSRTYPSQITEEFTMNNCLLREDGTYDVSLPQSQYVLKWTPQPAGCEQKTYKWSFTEWSQCSEPCGLGTVVRTVQCEDSTGTPAVDQLCTQPKPFETMTCLTKLCEQPKFVAGPWGTCSSICGGGIQTRTVKCTDPDENDVQNSLCAGEVPSTTQACNEDLCVYKPGPWGSCSADCGPGKQTRTVQCVDSNESPVENSLCTGQMSTERDCNGPCVAYQYKAGAWSECSTSNGQCGAGTKTRKVECIDQAGNSAKECQGDRPEDSQDCNISCESSCKSDAITDKRLWYIWTTKDGQKRYLSVDDDSLALADKRPRHGWIVSRHDKNEDAVRIQLHTDVGTKHSLHFEKKSLKASTKVHAIYIHKLTHHDTQSMQYQFSAHENGCKTPGEYTFDSMTKPIWTFERSGRGTDKRFHPISILIPLNWDEWVFWLALAGIIIAVVWVLFVLLSIASYAGTGSKITKDTTSKYEDMTKLKEDIDAKLKQIMNKPPQ